MRRFATGSVLSVLAVPMLLALPVTTRPTTAPHPVKAAEQTLSLGSFDQPAAGVRVSATRAPQSVEFPTGRALRTLSVRKTSTGGFSAVAVTWRSERGLGEVTVRVSGKHGAVWSKWETTSTEEEGAPAAGETSSGSGLVWLGDSEGVDLRVSGESGKAPRDVRVRLIDPGTSAADANPAGAAPRDQASADVARPTIYSRAQWGANESYMRWTPEYSSTLKAGFIHHTVQSNTYAAGDVPGMIRADYYYHSITRGWGDIGYNFLVDRFGRVWQGRAGDVTRPGIGAHTGGFNDYTFGISMIGDFSLVGVPAGTQEAIARVFAWKLALHRRDPLGYTSLTSTGGGTSRYAAGVTVTKPVIMGHRDVGATACPGGFGYAMIPAIRSRVTALMAPVLANPSLSTYSPAYAGSPLGMSALFRRSTGATVEIFDDCTGALRWRWTGSWSTRDINWLGSWNLRDSAGQLAQPGSYRLRLTALYGLTTTIWDAPFQIVGTTTAPAPSGTAAPRPRSAATLVPLSPSRVLDTRTGLGTTRIGKLAAGSSIRTTVAGHGGVPASGVTAALLTVTARCTTADTWLSLAASDGVVPATAPVVAPARSIRSMTVAVPLGPDGAIVIRNAYGFADVSVDVSGYYSTASTAGRFHPLAPARVYNAVAAHQPMMAGERRVVPISGQGGVPASATAVAVQLTAITSSYAGSIVLYGAGGSVLSGSTAEFRPGDVVRTQAVVQLTGGAIGMYSRANLVYPILEVVGYYAPSSVAGGLRYVALDPTHVFDTRSGAGIRPGPIGSTSPAVAPFAGLYGVPSSGAAAVALSLRSFSATTASWLRAYPSGTTVPTYGVLWNQPGITSSGIAWPGLGSSSVSFVPTSGSSQLIGDLSGYFTP